MIVHLNGQLIPLEQARISPLDRGFIFGDAIYEGLLAYAGRIVAIDRHIQRMAHGLSESRITGFDPASLNDLSLQLLDAAKLRNAFVYWQVSRGAPARGEPLRERVPHAMTPTVFGYAAPAPSIDAVTKPRAVSAVVRPDTRWLRGTVKSTSLLGNVIASIEADEAGADDAILVRDGLVAEATATNIFIAHGDALATPPLDAAPILAGVTRDLLLSADPAIEVRPIRAEELHEADEIMLVGTRTIVAAVTSLDARPVGTGVPGPAAQRLLNTLLDTIRRDVHSPHA